MVGLKKVKKLFFRESWNQCGISAVIFTYISAVGNIPASQSALSKKPLIMYFIHFCDCISNCNDNADSQSSDSERMLIGN